MELIERVRMERRLRGWSVRQAAAAGGISNQAWSVFERGGAITGGIHRAVMQAFSWPETWQTDPPEVPIGQADVVAELRSEIEGLRAQLAEVLEVMAQLTGELRRRDGDAQPRSGKAAQRRPAAG